MCLAVPMLLVSKTGNKAEVKVDGADLTIDISFTPEARPGDYVIVHAGFAIQRLDEAEAGRTLALFDQIIQKQGGD